MAQAEAATANYLMQRLYTYAETLHGLGLKVYIDNSFYLKKKNIKVI